MQNGSDELTPLQAAQRRLLQVACGNPAEMGAPAYVNGVLMSVRLNALIEMVGQNDPAFTQLFEETCVAQCEKLIAQLKAQKAQPRIALAN